jgi:hypothetical protein
MNLTAERPQAKSAAPKEDRENYMRLFAIVKTFYRIRKESGAPIDYVVLGPLAMDRG